MRYACEPIYPDPAPKMQNNQLSDARGSQHCHLRNQLISLYRKLPLLPKAGNLPQRRLGASKGNTVTFNSIQGCIRCTSIDVQVAELRTAAIDAAVELDHTKNDATIDQAAREKAQRIIERVFTACEALGFSIDISDEVEA
jgi:hypothetical protein